MNMCWKGAFFPGVGTQWVVSWGGFMCSVIICLRCSCEPPTKRWISVCLFLSAGPFSVPLLFSCSLFFFFFSEVLVLLSDTCVVKWSASVDVFFSCTVRAALPGSIVKNGCPSQVMAFPFQTFTDIFLSYLLYRLFLSFLFFFFIWRW